MDKLTEQENKMLHLLDKQINEERYNFKGHLDTSWFYQDPWNNMYCCHICGVYFDGGEGHGRWHIKNSKLGAFV